MIEVKQTLIFSKWLSRLKDPVAAANIITRIQRIEQGNFGSVKRLNASLSEIKVDIGKGYRIYYTKKGDTVVILLCGGDKKSQQRDITKAQQMVKTL